MHLEQGFHGMNMMHAEFGADLILGTGFSAPTSIGDLAYFVLIYDFIRNEIETFGFRLMENVSYYVGLIALTLLTLWILIQGFRISTGQSRDSMMVLVVNSLRATLIVGLATAVGVGGSKIHSLISNDLPGLITELVTDQSSTSAQAQIDKSLAYMQLAMSSIDALDVAGDEIANGEKERALWMVGAGTAGPAITGAALLLMYQVAMALFIGLGPLFVLCLLFDQTKQLFGKWLYYGIGTMFSLAVLAVMVAISTKVILAVAEAFWASSLAGTLLGQNFSDGMTSQAMQQGGIGLLLTVLIITTPPMAASFFQGTLGNFSPYVAFGAGAAASTGGGSYPPGRGPVNNMPYQPPSPSYEGYTAPTRSDVGRVTVPSAFNEAPSASRGERGLAGNRE